MAWQVNPIAVLPASAAVIALIAAWVVWRRRDRPGAVADAVLLLAAAEWSVAYALGLSSADLASKIFWAKCEYIGIVAAPPAFLLFAATYTGRGERAARGALPLLFLEPLAVLVLVWTNDWHGLIWSHLALDTRHSYTMLRLSHGPVFWMAVTYSYVLLGIGTFALAIQVVRAPAVYKRQALLLLASLSAPWIGNLLRLTGVVTTVDLTPIGFAFVGLGAVWGVMNLQLFDLSPVARHAVLGAMVEGVLVLDRQGRVVDANPTALALIGQSADEVIGRGVRDVLPDVPDLAGAATLAVQRPLGAPEDERWCEISTSSLRDHNGAAVGRLLLLRDVTAQRQAEKAVQQLSANLARRSIELEEISYSVSNDLRAPLRSIAGFSRMLEEEHAASLRPEAQEYIQRVRRSTRQLGQLIDALLALSQVSRSAPHLHPVDLSAIARRVAEDLRAAEPRREVTLKIEEGVVAVGDPKLLSAAMRHLLHNAWKYTSRHPRARIEFGVEKRAEGNVYYVRDDGAGFDMEYADRLFHPFQRLHSAAEFEGVGTGLATVRRIVALHGGRAWAEARVEHGTTVYFTLGEHAPGSEWPPGSSRRSGGSRPRSSR